MENKEKILVGKIVAPQGIRGEVRVQTYTQTPTDLKTLKLYSCIATNCLIIHSILCGS